MAAPVIPQPAAPTTGNGEPASPLTPNNEPVNTPEPIPGQPPQDNARLLELYDATLRDNHQRISQLERDLAEARRTPEPSPQNPTQADFWNDPATHIRRMIKEETQIAVQPLYDFKSQFENESAYDKLKGQFRNDARFKDIFSKIEPVVDQLMAGAPNVNAETMRTAILSAAGAYSLGLIPAQGGTPTNQPAPQNPGMGSPPAAPPNNGTPPAPGNPNVFTPPHLRPSGRQETREGATPQRRELNENERRLARERGWTDDQYLDWLEVPPDQVISSTIGKEKRTSPNQQTQHNAGAK